MSLCARVGHHAIDRAAIGAGGIRAFIGAHNGLIHGHRFDHPLFGVKQQFTLILQQQFRIFITSIEHSDKAVLVKRFLDLETGGAVGQRVGHLILPLPTTFLNRI